MPLPQQDFDFPQGADLTGVRSLSFTMDPDLFPNATVINWRLFFRRGFTLAAPSAFNRTGTGTVAGGKLLVPLASTVTAAIPTGQFFWDFWADTLEVPLAQGTVRVGFPKATT